MSLNLVKGVTLTPPTIGRITMGHTVLKGDKALPVKDDHFSITTLVQNKRDRSWEIHPLQAKHSKANEKLRAIPVRIAFNDPNLSLNSQFSAFEMKSGRVLCSGNGERARRATEDGVQDIVCPRPEACEYGQRQRCKNMSRAYVRIEGQEDELGVFILRTTSFNSLNYLATRLAALHGMTGGRIAGMPMMLVMESKTTTMSFREPFHFADLVQRPGMTLLDAIKEANTYQTAMLEAGLSLEGMEAALRDGLANGDFADEIEDLEEWVSDEDLIARATGAPAGSTGLRGLDTLAGKLKSKAATQTAGTEQSPDLAAA